MVSPVGAQIVSTSEDLQLSCAMNLDGTYSIRTIDWKLNGVNVRAVIIFILVCLIMTLEVTDQTLQGLNFFKKTIPDILALVLTFVFFSAENWDQHLHF